MEKKKFWIYDGETNRLVQSDREQTEAERKEQDRIWDQKVAEERRKKQMHIPIRGSGQAALIIEDCERREREKERVTQKRVSIEEKELKRLKKDKRECRKQIKTLHEELEKTIRKYKVDYINQIQNAKDACELQDRKLRQKIDEINDEIDDI